jgi:hypothetical protein
MNSVEDQVRAATRAQASALREVRPLRLPPAPGPAPAHVAAQARRRPLLLRPLMRRWQSWVVPVTAAVAIVAVAVSPVIVRDISNGRSTPPTTSTHSSAVPPRYYVAVTASSAGPDTSGAASSASQLSFTPNDLVVGDTVTGKNLATIAAPADSAWAWAAAAADDRTFVVFDEPATSAPGRAGTWWKMTLAPGAASPVTLTRLPIRASSEVGAMALSDSGTELAILTAASIRAQKRLCVYSVATGDLVRGCWSTADRTVFFMGFYRPGSLVPALTWVDNDKAIAFPTLGTVPVPHSNRVEARQTVRSVNLAQKGANLMADSQVIWSQVPASPDQSLPCDGGYVAVSADGKTVSCSVVYVSGISDRNPGRWRLAWLTYPTSAAADRQAAPVVDYELAVPAPTQPLESGPPLWVDRSGTALLASRSLGGKHLGLMSGGRFTPLPVPPALAGLVTVIAW